MEFIEWLNENNGGAMMGGAPVRARTELGKRQRRAGHKS